MQLHPCKRIGSFLCKNIGKVTLKTVFWQKVKLLQKNKPICVQEIPIQVGNVFMYYYKSNELLP